MNATSNFVTVIFFTFFKMCGHREHVLNETDMVRFLNLDVALQTPKCCMKEKS